MESTFNLTIIITEAVFVAAPLILMMLRRQNSNIKGYFEELFTCLRLINTHQR